MKLVDDLAGESPASADRPVGTVDISGDGAGDQAVGSPDVNVLDGWTLFRDASISLLRQWLVRSELWNWVVAAIAGVVPPILVFGDWDPLSPCSYAQNWKWILAAVAGVALLMLACGSPVTRAKLEGWVSCLGTRWHLKTVRQFRR